MILKEDTVYRDYIERTVGIPYIEELVKDILQTKEDDALGLESVRRTYVKGNYKVIVELHDSNTLSIDIIDKVVAIQALTINGILLKGEVHYTVESYSELVHKSYKNE